MERETSVTVRGLCKSYGDIRAVDGVDFDIYKGEVFGLLGPNGAGKTTTVEILEGLRTLSSGSVSVLNLDPTAQNNALKDRIGVCLQDTRIAPRASVIEVVQLFGACYSQSIDPRTLLERLGLWEKRDARYETLSGGQQQRLALALSLVNDPMLIFMDEPTAGLDPQSRKEVHEIIEGLRQEQRTILLTTHQIDEAAKLCDRVAILDHGKLVAIGSPLQLQELSSGYSLIVARSAQALVRGDLPHWPGVEFEEFQDDGKLFRIRTRDTARTVADLVRWMDENKLTLTGLETQRDSLEDAFLRLTADKEAE